MKQYTCVECSKMYNDTNLPQDYVCKDSQCPGGGLTGLIIEIQGQQPIQTGATYVMPTTNTNLREAGLCILLMDSSGSMGESAYRDYSFPSKYGGSTLTKREVITDIAAKAIFELQPMAKKDDAYLCAIKFDHRQSVMFTKTVSNILIEYGTPQNLAKFMYDELAEMNGGTDINSALRMAHSFVDKFVGGSLPGMGNYTPLTQSQYAPQLNRTIDVPNVRVLLYTDGEQLSEYGAIDNPFINAEPDLLMGAYIGQSGEKGCNDLKSVIGKCPIHGTEQFFVLDNPQKIATLRGLFRMASGTSGFCPTCIGNTTLR